MAGTILSAKCKSTVQFSCALNQHRSQLPLKPTEVKIGPTQHPHWASLHADVEAHLKLAIPMKEPLVVFEPMHHLVSTAPKTTVPALCLAACELVGGQRHQAMAAASALLLMHATGHAHKHLVPGPKPKPGPHAYSDNIKLLTGDGLVPFGFELLADSDDPNDENSGRILRVMVEISRAVGSEGLMDALYRETTWGTRSDGEELSHVEGVRHVVEKKEGGLHACGAACGAVLGGGSEEEIERLRRFGFYVGMMHGMLQMGMKKGEKEVEEARDMALKELQFFNGRGVGVISSFIDI